MDIRQLLRSIAQKYRSKTHVAAIIPLIYLFCKRNRGNSVHLTVRKLTTYILGKCSCPEAQPNIKARLNYVLSSLANLAKKRGVEDALTIFESNRLVYVWDREKLLQFLLREFPELEEFDKLFETDLASTVASLCEEVCK